MHNSIRHHPGKNNPLLATKLDDSMLKAEPLLHTAVSKYRGHRCLRGSAYTSNSDGYCCTQLTGLLICMQHRTWYTTLLNRPTTPMNNGQPQVQTAVSSKCAYTNNIVYLKSQQKYHQIINTVGASPHRALRKGKGKSTSKVLRRHNHGKKKHHTTNTTQYVQN